jgi:hypothetical protein
VHGDRVDVANGAVVSDRREALERLTPERVLPVLVYGRTELANGFVREVRREGVGAHDVHTYAKLRLALPLTFRSNTV